MDDDVFDEGIGDDVIPEDWAKIERARRTDGYRAGLEAGQEAALQGGFNRGFSEGIVNKFTISFMKGVISALLAERHSSDEDPQNDSEEATVAELEAMMSDLDSLQQDFSQKMVKKSWHAVSQGESKPGSGAAVKIEGGDSDNGIEAAGSSASLAEPLGASSTTASTSGGFATRSEGTGEESGGHFSASGDAGGRWCGGDRPSIAIVDHPLHEIYEKLLPHLERMKCSNLLADTSHPFLRL
ncbi:uncharacterized protein [Diadema antillarum]|uniref:uncharacterized protein n=1 Tax=Diadema antillarum TaxID=105358 RepID=UPI003A88775B